MIADKLPNFAIWPEDRPEPPADGPDGFEVTDPLLPHAASTTHIALTMQAPTALETQVVLGWRARHGASGRRHDRPGERLEDLRPRAVEPNR